MPDPIRLTDEQLEELTRGLPQIVQIDGREVVVQDAEAYQRMIHALDKLESAEIARICQERWEALQSGEDPGVSGDELLARLKQRLRQAG